MDPDPEEVLEPEEMNTTPPAPAPPALPADSIKDPPTADVEAVDPPKIVMSLPVPDDDNPTRTDTAPLRPPTARPLPSKTSPEFPEADDPLEITTVPDTPA